MACAGSMRSGGVVVGGRPAALATTVARRCAPARACAARATSRAECESEASSPRLDRFLAGAASLTSLATTGPDAAAMADEIAADVVATPEADVQAGDFAIADGIILFAPLIIYGEFSRRRSSAHTVQH